MRTNAAHNIDQVRLPSAFWKIWSSTVVDGLGDGAWTAALPLLVVAGSGSAIDLTWVSVATYLPWLLVSLSAGAILDTAHHARVLVWAQALQAAIALSLTAIVALGDYSIAWIVVLAFGLGVAEVFASNAQQVMLPDFVGSDELTVADARLSSAMSLSNQLIGPSLGGLIFSVAAWFALGLNAVSFVASIVIIAPLAWGRRAGARPAAVVSRQGQIHAIGEGLTWLLKHRLLRALLVLFAASMVANQVVMAMLALIVKDHGSEWALGYGAILSCTAVGGLLASFVAHKVISAVGESWAVIGSVMVSGLVLLVPSVVQSTWVIAGVMAVMAGAGVVWNVVVVTLRQRLSPPRLLGRVNSAFRMAGWGLLPVGSVIGGLVATLLGLEWVFPASAVIRLVTLFSCGLVILRFRSVMAGNDVSPLDADGSSETLC